ncbi:SLOG family protein [Roseococcus pinisoli]|uniref:DUF2493 domain-containing protein n=1 Tax=Roseococcus pinisoli TaxID=2835040 RepID=A0ABS5QF37_9PROT|nr:SLOG family protein [Roseococcus pinisoli]MBS7812307.1 DUF2493 domain-containing protein [Roseococcus pinisoli]
MSIVLLVCGGRGYGRMPEVYNRRDKAALMEKARLEWVAGWAGMDKVHQQTPVRLLIQGEAPGGDAMAKAWAAANKIPCRGFPADWKAHPKSAGPIRNRQMLVEGKPDAVLALPGHKGTEDMVKQARRVGLPVYFLAGAA